MHLDAYLRNQKSVNLFMNCAHLHNLFSPSKSFSPYRCSKQIILHQAWVLSWLIYTFSLKTNFLLSTKVYCFSFLFIRKFWIIRYFQPVQLSAPSNPAEVRPTLLPQPALMIELRLSICLISSGQPTQYSLTARYPRISTLLVIFYPV